jgi:hypothetical protein
MSALLNVTLGGQQQKENEEMERIRKQAAAAGE